MKCEVRGCDRAAAWVVEASARLLWIICDEHKREFLEDAVLSLGHGDPETERVVRESMEMTAHPLTEQSLN